MDKDYIRAIAAFEQASAHLSQFAAMMSSYHNSLCEAGFQRDEALKLVCELQKILFSQSFGLNSGSEE